MSLVGALLGLLAGVGLWWLLPGVGAGALLHPLRRTVTGNPPAHCVQVDLTGEGVTLRGWVCRTLRERRGTVVLLHGVADTRHSMAAAAERYLARGFDAIAYDSRAHGDSGGEACTYGFYEARDLRRVVEAFGQGPVVLIGTSMGAAVALQEAAFDRRVAAVVAAESFADLRTVVRERAPVVFSGPFLRLAFERAEQLGRFQVDDVSPLRAAASLAVPVLIVHGDADAETRPEHARRIFAALKGAKRLMLVPGAGHNQSLTPDVWSEIDAWIDAVLPPGLPAGHQP